MPCVCSTAFAAEAVPLPCVLSAAFAAKTVPLPCGLAGARAAEHHRDVGLLRRLPAVLVRRTTLPTQHVASTQKT